MLADIYHHQTFYLHPGNTNLVREKSQNTASYRLKRQQNCSCTKFGRKTKIFHAGNTAGQADLKQLLPSSIEGSVCY